MGSLLRFRFGLFLRMGVMGAVLVFSSDLRAQPVPPPPPPPGEQLLPPPPPPPPRHPHRYWIPGHWVWHHGERHWVAGHYRNHRD